MRWDDEMLSETPAGLWAVMAYGDDGFLLTWYPAGLSRSVSIGMYRTSGAAKGAAKRYAKKLAAAFKAMGKAGWQ